MDLKIDTINLEAVYSIEPDLGIERIEYFKSLGIEGILNICEGQDRLQLEVALIEDQSRVILQVIEGCHRARALYDLGYRTVSSQHFTLCSSNTYEGYNPLKLKEVAIKPENERQEE